MSVNISRNMNAELQEGSTDGSYKKMPPDRSVVENHLAERREMSWRYGFEDAPVKYLPTGQIARRAYDDHG